MRKPIVDDEEELYIPDIEDVNEDIDLHGQYPRSNAGIALGWSPLEQQMFDMLLLNRFAQYDREILDEAPKIKILRKNIKNILTTLKSTRRTRKK